MPCLELKNVSKSYGTGRNRVQVLENINLSVTEGEFLAVLGFSGSGKTTLISLIAGLISPDEGQILLDGKPVDGPGPDRAVVFQNYSLLPWLTARQNVALAVDHLFPDWHAEKRGAHIDKYLEMVNLSKAVYKRPSELSGGMRQRVSVARTLAMNPRILLLDEPFGALEALTRGMLQAELEKIWSLEKKTVILITNDIDEAILLADRIVPLHPGPQATLGPEFPVHLGRPRDKKLFDENVYFKTLRNSITNHLIEIRNSHRKALAEVSV